MTGTLIFKKHISKQDVLEKFPNTIFLFGDNMRRQGYGGQASNMRGHPNSFGVPTKWAPDTQKASYFKDEDFEFVEDAIRFPLTIAYAFMMIGKTVVVPTDGLGTGLAELPTRAPKIFAFIENRITMLANNATTINHED
jgi:hypothetical protein